jgi:hypothetical protein
MKDLDRGPALLRPATAGRLAGVAAASAVAVTYAAGGAAWADKPPMLHSVESIPFEAGFVCGDIVLSAVGGTETEKVDAVLVGDRIHYNLVRSYQHLVFAGSDGGTYRGGASVHLTALLDATGEPISTREVVHVAFGSPGFFHEVIVDDDAPIPTGSCEIIDE